MRKKSLFLKAILLIFLVLISLGFYYGYKFFSFYNKIYEKKSLANGAKPVKKEKTEYNILLLGYGGPGHDGAYLTDTIILAHIDKKKKEIDLISIPRDLWVKVPHKTQKFIHSKINALYSMLLFPEKYPFLPDEYKDKSPAFLLSEIVTEITGYKPDYFVAIDFKGFVKVIDMLGGVRVYLDKYIEDFQYPIEGKEKDLCGWKEEDLATLEARIATEPAKVFPCRYERFYLPAGWNELDGETALKLVRSRKGINSGGDFGRAERQQKVIKAAVEKALSLGIVSKIPEILDELSNHIKTDIPLSEIKKNLDEVKKFNEYKIRNIVLSLDNVLVDTIHPTGGYILYPKTGIDDWEKTREFIKQSLIDEATKEAELKNSTSESQVELEKAD